MESLARDAALVLEHAAPVGGNSDGDEFVPALLSGGNSRIAVDRITGTNPYLCPPLPAPELICFASCTASPIGQRSFRRAAETFRHIADAASQRLRARRIAEHAAAIAASLLRHFEASGLAEAILCPSGTDALLTAALMVAAERPGQRMTAILPCAAETGTHVPLAVACRRFDGPDCGVALSEDVVGSVEIPLRTAAGEPRSEDELNGAYAAAAATAAGRPIIYLTHGTKTGLIAPAALLDRIDVIVDACQARIEPATVAAYLRRGWPVVVTGSKFFGGPAFSGAVLFPTARLAASRHRPLPDECVNLGTVLRWTAALDVIEAFEPMAAGMALLLHDTAAAVQRLLASVPALAPVEGLRPRGPGWADLPSIFTFGVRDPQEPLHRLSATALRPLYQRLARAGVLLGQPVDLGPFGGLRIALGARDLVERPHDGGWSRLSSVLETALAAPSWRQEQLVAPVAEPTA